MSSTRCGSRDRAVLGPHLIRELPTKPMEPLPLPEILRSEIKQLLVQALIADVKSHPNLTQLRASVPPTVGTGRGRARRPSPKPEFGARPS
jgi:hypothetical protein